MITILNTCVISKDHYVKPILYDVQFGNGARFCVESEQIEFVEGFEETKSELLKKFEYLKEEREKKNG